MFRPEGIIKGNPYLGSTNKTAPSCEFAVLHCFEAEILTASVDLKT